jgi:hypothetical protein
MDRARVVVGDEYAYGASKTFRYLVMDRVQWAFAHEPVEHVQVVEHVRWGKFRVAWVGVDPSRIEVVDAIDLLSPWNERQEFLETERRLAVERWAYLDEMAGANAYLATQASSVRSQWRSLKDEYPAGYAAAARDLLLRFGHTPPDDPNKERWERFANSTWSGFLVLLFIAAFLAATVATFVFYLNHAPNKDEVNSELVGTAVSVVLGGLTWLQTKSWIRAHRRGTEVDSSRGAMQGLDVRFAGWMAAGDGLVPLLRTWAVCTAVFLIALVVVAAAS